MALLKRSVKAKRKLQTRKSSSKKKARAPRKKTTVRRKARTVSIPRSSLPSYEEALLKSMMDADHPHKVTAYALLLNSTLSNFSKGLRELHYKSGISTGRSLYRLYEGRRRYRWYEDSIPDLLMFLEKAGYKNIMYHIFPDMMEITLQEGSGVYTGMKMHAFEAGVISGFLTAAKRQLVHVNEELCANNGSGACRFVSSSRRADSEPGLDMTERISDYLNAHTHEMKKASEHVPEEYYMLSYLMFMHKSYANEMKRIMLHIGIEMGKGMNATKSNAEMLMGLFGFGEIKIESMKPLKAEIRYERLRAREEFVGMSLSFLDGLLAGKTGNSGISVTAEAKANRYIVKLTEMKAPRKR